jgi:inhibitor of KinA
VNYKIFPVGENALTIDFGNIISAELNDLVLSLADYINKNLFPGFIETVPAYSSLTVFYDLIQVRLNYPNFSTAYSAVENYVELALENLEKNSKFESRVIEIPVCYDGEEFAPDLRFVAENAQLTTQEVIKIHTSKTYRVYMLGFLPAFAYMGEVNERIAAPRRQTPRTKIAAGSVGIAGKQTGIYPLESPGGWQIIGATPLKMFQPLENKVSYLQTGDSVSFYQISKKEFQNLNHR